MVTRAKRYARARGVSVSRLVEEYLDAVSAPGTTSGAPILESLRGVLKKADLQDYRKHLARKYR